MQRDAIDPLWLTLHDLAADLAASRARAFQLLSPPSSTVHEKENVTETFLVIEIIHDAAL